MRTLNVKLIENAVARLARQSCLAYPPGVEKCLREAYKAEISPQGRAALELALQNAQAARQDKAPLCQDTGMAVVFLELGQEVHLEGGFLTDAVNKGVRRAYKNFRKSVLDPLTRLNTGDNTPAVLHTEIVPGDTVTIHYAPKGFGSENMSALAMLKPSDGLPGAVDFIVNTVARAGSNPCPPVVVGVGIGGTMEKAALMAKHSLLRPLGDKSPNPELRMLEEAVLQKLNTLGIGPQGLGGRVTALAVHMESYPTHLAGLPVAVNMQCHCARHASETL